MIKPGTPAEEALAYSYTVVATLEMDGVGVTVEELDLLRIVASGEPLVER